jgi:protein SCO1/2
VTFIFTRCPVPEYCPAIAGRFREVQRALAKDASLADVRLLSVTLDPQHDTPPVLRDYGRAMGADFTRWRFATGTPEQVAALTRVFAVYTQASGGTIDHTLATALIDARGRVVEIWRGHLWETRDVIDVLNRLTRAG